jgi:hypothetical protein
MLFMQRHALTLFVPAQHCVGGAAALKADECGLGMGATTAQDGCEIVFSNHQIRAHIINMLQNAPFIAAQIYSGHRSHSSPGSKHIHLFVFYG